VTGLRSQVSVRSARLARSVLVIGAASGIGFALPGCSLRKGGPSRPDLDTLAGAFACRDPRSRARPGRRRQIRGYERTVDRAKRPDRFVPSFTARESSVTETCCKPARRLGFRSVGERQGIYHAAKAAVGVIAENGGGAWWSSRRCRHRTQRQVAAYARRRRRRWDGPRDGSRSRGEQHPVNA